jgi:non-ribosomal peptide synthetase component F
MTATTHSPAPIESGTPATDRDTTERLDFWATQAARLEWSTPWTRTLSWDPPYAQWFSGGRLNAAVNCVDRHVRAGHGDRAAMYFEGEPGDTRTLTYAQLADEVGRAANALIEFGVGHGDRVVIYLPMIPEAVIAIWPARESVPSTRSSSVDSPRRRSSTASPTPGRRWSSPQTAVTGEARCRR